MHDKGQGQFDDDGKLQHLDGAIFITVTSAVAGPHVRLMIGDSGRAFPPTCCRASTRNFGAGLGLPITRQIVEHGGTIAIESPPEGGATVTIWLPLLAQQAAA